jgi:hypothetical protein
VGPCAPSALGEAATFWMLRDKNMPVEFIFIYKQNKIYLIKIKNIKKNFGTCSIKK